MNSINEKPVKKQIDELIKSKRLQMRALDAYELHSVSPLKRPMERVTEKLLRDHTLRK